MHKVPDSEQYIELLVKSLAADYEEKDDNEKVEKQVIQFIKENEKNLQNIGLFWFISFIEKTDLRIFITQSVRNHFGDDFTRTWFSELLQEIELLL